MDGVLDVLRTQVRALAVRISIKLVRLGLFIFSTYAAALDSSIRGCAFSLGTKKHLELESNVYQVFILELKCTTQKVKAVQDLDPTPIPGFPAHSNI